MLQSTPRCLPCFQTLPTTAMRPSVWTGPASTSGITGAADPSLVQDATQPISPYFLTPGATTLESTTLTGASWYVLNMACQWLPTASFRVLVMQVTTAGSISGQINFQVFPLGVGANQQQVSIAFDGAGTFGGGGGACGCTDPTCVNYDETAQYDDGSVSTTRCPVAPMQRPATSIWTPPSTTDPCSLIAEATVHPTCDCNCDCDGNQTRRNRRLRWRLHG